MERVVGAKTPVFREMTLIAGGHLTAWSTVGVGELVTVAGYEKTQTACAV
jgi:hypothetical protein